MSKEMSIARSIEDRVEIINELTDGVRQAFYLIAEQMVLIREEPRFHKVDAKGVVKMNREGEPIRDRAKYLAYLEETTGYKATAVRRFLRGYKTIRNIAENSPIGLKIADFETKIPEGSIRKIATKKLIARPEKQAEVFTRAYEMAGEEIPDQSHVGDAYSEVFHDEIITRKQAAIRRKVDKKKAEAKALEENAPDLPGMAENQKQKERRDIIIDYEEL